MRKKLNPRSAFFNPRFLISFAFCTIGVLLALFAFGLYPGGAAWAQGPGQNQGKTAQAKLQGLKPQVGRAVKFGETIALRDMPAAGEIDLETQTALDRPVINEKNTALERVPRAGAPLPSIDEAIAGKQSNSPQISSVTPPATGSFEGLADTDNSTAGLGLVNPPDTNADVGYTQIVETVKAVFRVYDKTGAPLTPVLKQSTLFAALGGQCAETNPGDPIVLHDRIADRWQISQNNFAKAGNDPPFHQCIAISKTSDAAGEYYLYDFITPGPNDFPDYPKLAVWPDGYYMSTRQLDADTTAFLGLGLFAFNREKMLRGDPTAEMIFFFIPFDANYPSGTSTAIIPSDHDGLLPPPSGAPNVFAIYDDDELGAGDLVHLFDFHADFTTPANSTFTERTESPLALPAFDDRNPAGGGDIEEPSPGENLDSVADRLMHRMAYRNRGGVESLVTNHTVNVSGVNPTSAATYQAAPRYYEFRKTTPGGAYSVYDSATYSPDAGNGATGTNRWMGSAAIDDQGNLAMGYSSSSTTLLPSIVYVGRAFNELGPSLTNEVVLFPGQGTQAAGDGNRWGDYTSVSVDPVDDCTFWYANEYWPPGNSGFNWHTRIGNFKFPTCTAPAQGTLTGTITACDSGAPLGEVLIQTTGGPSEGFSAATADDGTYTVHLAPGTYSVTASSSIRNCQASASSQVVITDGGVATFNTCLNGVAKLILPENDPTPAVVSGGNGDGQIDKNECNMLDVHLQNAGCAPATNVGGGCAPATNVVATLSTTTPEVMISQPYSDYPDIPVDGTATNITPFKVSTSPSFVCGTTIVFTLTTTHAGGTDVQTFTLQTCQLPPQPFSGTIQTGDPQTTNGRLGRNGVSADCSGKVCPGPLGSGGRSYDQFSFVNQGGVAACVKVNTQSVCGAQIFTGAYLGSFDPTNLCTNYLGDAGASSTDMNFEVTVPAGGTLVVAVMEPNAGTTCAYTGTVSGLIGAADGGGECAQPTPTPTPTPNPVPSAPTATAATNVTSSSFTANWNSVSCATGYRLDVATSSSFTDKSFVSGYQDLDVGNATSRSITGLKAGTIYYYRVRAYNGGGTSGNSNVITVTTVPAAPSAKPAKNITTTGFTANWSNVKGATGYQLDVSTSSTFTSYLTGYQNLNVGNATSRNVTGLSANTTYYYRVRAYNGAGTSGNSNVITVLTAPVAPTASAATNVTTTSFIAHWSSVSGATGYRLDVSTSSTFGSYVTGYHNLNVGNATSRSVTGLSANTTYYYRVRAYNGGGTSGNSNVISVKTKA